MIELTQPVYALYARVSHDDEIQDPEAQLIPLRKFCEEKGSKWKEYVDFQTGRTIEREHYQRALSEIESWDILMVYAPDRLTREGPERGMVEVDNLLKKGKPFRTLLGSLFIEKRMDAMTRGFMRMAFTFAAMESDIISDRTIAGMEVQRMKIERDGYTISKRSGNKITTLGRQPAVKVSIEEVLSLKDEGLSLQEIADRLGSKKSTIHGMLKRKFS